jgi:peptidoglycan hydrolase-like protein with peptidoglycan-binding domain
VRRGGGALLVVDDADDDALLDSEGPTLPVLRQGAVGSSVRDLQSRLRALGHDPGVVDGVFGAKTSAAVRLFQHARGLAIDGVVGSATWRALGAAPSSGVGAPASALPATPAAVAARAPTLAALLRALARKSYRVFTEPQRVNIVGVRSDTAEPNRFDDFISLFFKNDAGVWTFESYPATTDPGTYYLLNPMNVTGTAIVQPGQYPSSHQIGLHRGQYAALVQRGKITVIRDANEDSRLDLGSSVVETGQYGINIHRASASGVSSRVDRFSAGCQVLASASDFARFMAWCERHASRHGNDFTYTLLEEKDVPG